MEHGLLLKASMDLFICRRLSLLKLNSKPTSIRLFGSVRPLVKLDVKLENEINDGEVKARKHHGVFNRGVSRLPDKLMAAIGKIVQDLPDKNLLQEARKLNNHLIFKKPQLTDDEMNAIKLNIETEILAKSPAEGCSVIYFQLKKRLNHFSMFLRRRKFQCERSEKTHGFQKA